MTGTDFTTLFQRFANVKVGVIGDFALDLYFSLNTQTGERSLETGKDVFRAAQPVASLGAAGNVVQNLTALGVSQIWAIGCVGNDLFGREIQHLFCLLGVNTDQVYVPKKRWDTCLYTKPNQNGDEANRIDFGADNALNDADFGKLIAGLEQLLPALDVLIINQQFSNPLLPEKRIGVLNRLVARFPNVQYVADMRDVGRLVQWATLKVNTTELAKFLRVEHPQHPTLDWCIKQGRALQRQRPGPLLITRGADGMLHVGEAGNTHTVAGLPLSGPLDTVGAGDTVVATWAVSTGAGAMPEQALEVANLAAAVTVQKLAQTGTASLPEILALHDKHLSHD